jgi:uncharacterized iron-regulated membrane protein
MKRFRTVLFWIHLAAGLTAGVVVLIMSITGVALTYQRQTQWWADTRHYYAAPPAATARLPAARLIDAVQAIDPDTPATTVTFRSEPGAPAAVALGQRTIYVNPYTAQVYGEGTGQSWRTFFSTMTSWHRYLAMTGDSRATGRAITGASNLLFLFLVLSGIYLWWPRSIGWAQFRNILWFRRGLRPKARDFNWHHVLGFWSAIPLAIVVYSGVVISYPAASNMLYRAFGETPPAPAAGRASGPGGRGQTPADGRGGGRGVTVIDGPGRAGAEPNRRSPESAGIAQPLVALEPPPTGGVAATDVDRVLERAMAYEPGWTILSARVPAARTGTTTVTIDRGDGGQPQLRGTLTIDVATGDVKSWDGFSTQTPGRRTRSFLRFAHTGEYFGLIGQTLAGLVSLAAVVLVYTGFALSWRRFREWRERRRRGDAVRAAA